MKNEIIDRIARIRTLMQHERIDAYYISGADSHMSEYISEHWKTRRFVTGFTGSYGEVVVTLTEAGLWTDTRYFLQAEDELKTTGIKMHKLRTIDSVPVPQWLAENIPANSRIGIDPFSLSFSAFCLFKEALAHKNVEIVPVPHILNKVWHNRPPLPCNPIFELPESVAGESRTSKFNRILKNIAAKGADTIVLTALDDIAWTFNLRGGDISYNPVFYAFAIITLSAKKLFICKKALAPELLRKLSSEGIEILDYDNFYTALESLHGHKIYFDPNTTNSAVGLILQQNCIPIEGLSVAAQLKAIKNSVELDGFREAMRSDGVAMLRAMHWLCKHIGKENITEYDVSQKLSEFRKGGKGFRQDSFAPIIGYKEHGAMVHFGVTRENALPIQAEGILLFDSGGQYETGTTDITRTIGLGKATEQQKHDFTLVLKGMIALSTAVFPEGTKGAHIDMLARKFLWEKGLDYGHGTGHGIGHFLNVHEGPAAIRREFNPYEIQAGMVFSNEPGLYRNGQYGIRTENMMVCIEKEITEFGRFLAFETLTLCPIDTTLIILEMLSEEEKNWLNRYHQKVREQLSELLNAEMRDFLEKLTEPV